MENNDLTSNQTPLPRTQHLLKNHSKSTAKFPKMSLPSVVFPLFILLFVGTHQCALAASSLADNPIRLLRAPSTKANLEQLDPTLPPPLPGQKPTCSVLVLQQDFADTVGLPPAAANYTMPPDCPAPWTRIILELSISASDVQKDRIAAVWIDGAEVLRTSTSHPTSPGAFWRVQKDITRYTALLRRLDEGSSIVSMMLENSNAELPGVYSVNVFLHFYRGAMSDERLTYTTHPTVKALYREPADLIIPISQDNGYYSNGFWFRIDNESDVPATSITIPRNAYRAVLEIFASSHGDDELWYTKALHSAYSQQQNGLSEPKANGAFRQIYVTIDGKFVGGHIPFAVIYPGSINPYFWSPVAAIGAFDMPTYDLDVTPFLEMLLDGQPHEIGLGVRDGQSYWLVSANLHLWIDMWSDTVVAGLVEYYAPQLKLSKQAEWRHPDGQSEINAEGLTRFVGWTSSSKGNITTEVRLKVKFKSQVEVQNRGAIKQVETTKKQRSSVGLRRGNQILGRVQLLVEAPLQLQMSTVPAVGSGVFEKTKLYHQLLELVNLNAHDATSSITSTLTDRQYAEGSTLKQDGVMLFGGGYTRSSYKYRDANVCYLRTVNTAGGLVKSDIASPSCTAINDA